jgi:hypothetical protein
MPEFTDQKDVKAAGSVMEAMIMFVKNKPLVEPPMLGPVFYHVDSLTGEALVYNNGTGGFANYGVAILRSRRQTAATKADGLPASQENPPRRPE